MAFFVRLAQLLSLLSYSNIKLARSMTETQRQKDLLAVTLASIGDAVIVTDSQGRVTFLNGEAERLTGWTNGEAEGRPLTTVFHIINEQTRQPVEDPVRKVFRLGTAVGLANHTILDYQGRPGDSHRRQRRADPPKRRYGAGSGAGVSGLHGAEAGR